MDLKAAPSYFTKMATIISIIDNISSTKYPNVNLNLSDDKKEMEVKIQNYGTKREHHVDSAAHK